MRVAVLHQAVPENAREDERDVLDQVRAVTAALEDLGHRAAPIPCTADLDHLAYRLEADRPDLCFNLVESLDARDSDAHLVPHVLERLGLPFTGCPAAAVQDATDKRSAKLRLRQHRIPTPDAAFDREPLAPGLWIVKSVTEHASLGLDEDSVVPHDRAWSLAAHRERQLGVTFFAERYIAGREFNLALLDGELLAAPEMVFEHWDDTRPRVVGYAAKWHESTPAYRHTVRDYAWVAHDPALLHRLRAIALDCWHAFGLAGAARIDARVDHQGNPFVIDVNANPCLSPDAGFIAAAAQRGLTYSDVIARLIAAAPRRPPESPRG